MSEEKKSLGAPAPELDERTISKKYGLRELSYPDVNQVLALSAFLSDAVETALF